MSQLWIFINMLFGAILVADWKDGAAIAEQVRYLSQEFKQLF